MEILIPIVEILISYVDLYEQDDFYKLNFLFSSCSVHSLLFFNPGAVMLVYITADVFKALKCVF